MDWRAGQDESMITVMIVLIDPYYGRPSSYLKPFTQCYIYLFSILTKYLFKNLSYGADLKYCETKLYKQNSLGTSCCDSVQNRQVCSFYRLN